MKEDEILKAIPVVIVTTEGSEKLKTINGPRGQRLNKNHLDPKI